MNLIFHTKGWTIDLFALRRCKIKDGIDQVFSLTGELCVCVYIYTYM